MYRHRAILIGVSAAVVGALGCGDKMHRILQPNQPPTVRLLAPQLAKELPNGREYALRWEAQDPDGRVEHYLVALDPEPAANDRSWTRVTEPTWRVTVTGNSGAVESVHRFAVRAVDNRGAMSEPAVVALGVNNIPPSVQITCPVPSALITPLLPPAFRIDWRGIDPDGLFTQYPVKYKYILLSPSSEFLPQLAAQDPDSLRRYYLNHPLGPWAGWDSTSAETTHVSFSSLNPSTEYMFAVIAFDEAGDYSPIFSLNSNLLRFRVGIAQTLGPVFTVRGESFEYRYVSGGYFDTPERHARIEIAAGAPYTVTWNAQPSLGSCGLRGYRWVLDPKRLDDPKPREDANDLGHWSEWSATVTSATLGPFSPLKSETHTLYIEGDDGFGVSLAIVDLVAVSQRFSKDLLIVDDTRLTSDVSFGGVVQPPIGSWPTAAELDTFFFARGGVQWRSYPEGTLSPPGVFAGYSFDTLGTRIGRADLSVPLAKLAKYRNVIWYTDYRSAKNPKPGTDPVDPMGALVYMGAPGRANSLASYVRMGGHLWLLGGSAGLAASLGFNDPSNDRLPVNATITLSNTIPRELGPGRFMYDIAKWQSEFRILRPEPRISRSVGRFTDALADPYAGLPVTLDAKTPGTDPLAVEAPIRTASSFYVRSADIEFLQVENFVIDGFTGESTLDTLYRVRAATLPDPQPDPARSPNYVIMTYYHGQGSSVVFSGFPIWFSQRSQCTQLVDFVLQNLWGLSRSEPVANEVPRLRGATRRR